MDLWAAVAQERAALVETFEALTDDEWATPSLCGHWTVRQVLGHLVVAARPSPRSFTAALVRARGSFDRANDQLAVAQAARPVEELLAAYRALITTRRTPPGFGVAAPLTDVLLHSLDVRLPLGVPSDRPVDRWAPCLGLLFDRRAQLAFVPKGRPALHWKATDLPWEHGTGADVEGLMADLALAASGRAARVDALTGPGQPALAAWLAP